MKAYKSELNDKLAIRYRDQGGSVERVKRLINRDAPKADFKIDNKYANVMDNLNNQLGGKVDTKQTIDSTTKALTEKPKDRSADFENTGLNIIKSRTAEEASTANPRLTSIRKKKKTN